MNAQLLTSLAYSLLLTLIIETSFFLIIGKRRKKDLILVCLVNILTNPPVVLLYWLTIIYSRLNPIFAILVLESSAIIIEGYYYKNYGQEFSHPYTLSLIANLLSFGIGLLI
ncbi:MAG: hypothetical protein GX079_07090 [Tissierellia bacterium]|nr:hypothetical protein [Tissierellia bacterium]